MELPAVYILFDERVSDLPEAITSFAIFLFECFPVNSSLFHIENQLALESVSLKEPNEFDRHDGAHFVFLTQI